MSKLVDFQKSQGLKPDGIIGPITLRRMQEIFRINSKESMAHFIGQCHHESGGFSLGRENLNYSEKGLLKTFTKYFTTNTKVHPHKKLASAYARKPQAIGNWVYANRMGNGDEASGDGYHFRGAGPIQLTGKFNIEAFANHIDDQNIMKDPGIIVQKYYFESALFFFKANNLWKFCTAVNPTTVLTVSRAINLGNPYSRFQPNHLADRIAQTEKFYNLLKR